MRRILIVSLALVSLGLAAPARGAVVTQVGVTLVPQGSPPPDLLGWISTCWGATTLGTVLGGGLVVEAPLAMDISMNAPGWPGDAIALRLQPDGPSTRATGWSIKVRNFTGAMRQIHIAAVCSDTIAATPMIASNTLPAGVVDDLSALCPSATVAVAGGVDVENAAAMVVMGSHPILPGPLDLIEVLDGTNHPAPIGWKAWVRNDDSVSRLVKVAAICTSAVSVSTVVGSSPVAPRSLAYVDRECPGIALSGGLQTSNPTTVRVAGSAPLFPEPFRYLDQRADGEAPAPIGWSSMVYNGSDISQQMRAATICTPEPEGALAGSVALAATWLCAASRRRLRRQPCHHDRRADRVAPTVPASVATQRASHSSS